MGPVEAEGGAAAVGGADAEAGADADAGAEAEATADAEAPAEAEAPGLEWSIVEPADGEGPTVPALGLGASGWGVIWGPNVQVAAPPGVQAAIPAATRPPPATAAPRRKLRRDQPSARGDGSGTGTAVEGSLAGSSG
jgi:hypothetical protein